MTSFADFRRWLREGLRKLYSVDLAADALSSIQQAAITRNRQASEENCVAAKHASDAINDLLTTMEARRRGHF